MVKLFNYSFPYNYLGGAKMGQGRVGCFIYYYLYKANCECYEFCKISVCTFTKLYGLSK